MIDRQEWLEARRKGIGGTDAAAILGLSRYRTAIDVYEDKAGISGERPATAAMEWGRRLEDALAVAYTETTGRRVRRVGMRRAHHVKDYPMLGSIDRETYLGAPGEPGRIVELKKKRSSDDLGGEDDPPERRVPADWYVQVQHYMEVADRDVADVAVLVGGIDFRVIEIPRDRQYGADLREEEGAFWRDYVLKGEYPPASADDLANLSRRWSSTDDEKVATAEQSMLVDAYLDADQAVDEAEQRRDEFKAKLMEAMGDAGKLVAPGATVSWRSHDRTTTSWKEVAKVYRDALEQIDALMVDGRAWPEQLATLVRDPDLVSGLYSATSNVRPFRVDKKNGGTK